MWQSVFLSMNSSVTIQGNGGRLDEAVIAANLECQRLSGLWSRFRPESLISELNREPDIWHSVDADTAKLLQAAIDYQKLTSGAFDVCFGAIRDIPALQREADYFRVLSGSQIGLGGIAKSFAVERVIEILREYAVESALVNFGQSAIGVLGEPESGDSWRVGIHGPEPAQAVNSPTLALREGFISISGNYEAPSAQGSHIRDPRTGNPANSALRSVTVISDDSCLAKAISTAMIVMGVGEGLDFQREVGGFEAVFIEDSNELICTPGL
ncbi:MAG: FAD:protein FMN transferase [Propionibacteriaceae bacterium]|jgi:thiamine biosynthesis lipoprotein|nr:FAD:protein FMN transferase [Propionibacteriaceae bacterium]